MTVIKYLLIYMFVIAFASMYDPNINSRYEDCYAKLKDNNHYETFVNTCKR